MAKLWIRIELTPDGKIGPGKIALLEAIDRAGSISAAARDLGMSYRRAWLLVDETNRLFRDKVVEASMGGAQGGGAALSALGRELIIEYRAIERDANRAVEFRLAALEAACADEPVTAGSKNRSA